MQICKTLTELKQAIDPFKHHYKRIGFVPTMGALHEGHISLYQRCKSECDITVASIFVNPIQFNNEEDLKKYPRTEAHDLDMLKSVGCDIVFMPPVEVMYPETSEIKIFFGNIETTLEGQYRPGHFSGVGVVVSKLFNMVRPDVAYFGQKDLQQYLIIKFMVNQLSFPVEVVCCEIKREVDGLAMSSRNVRIAPEHRVDAAKIYQSLLSAQNLIQKSSIENIKSQIAAFYAPNTFLELEYFEIVSAETLQPLQDVNSSTHIAICVACKLGAVRLVDNLIYSPYSSL